MDGTPQKMENNNSSESSEDNYVRSTIQTTCKFVFPLALSTAILLNITSSIVFIKNRKSNKLIHQYLATNSIIDVLSSILLITVPYFHCTDVLDSTQVSTWSSYTHSFINLYLIRVTRLVSSLLSIVVILYRYLSIIGIDLKCFNFKQVILLFTIVSLLIFTPNLLLIRSTNIDASMTQSGFILLQWLPNALCLITMLALTLILVYELRKLLNKKFYRSISFKLEEMERKHRKSLLLPPEQPLLVDENKSTSAEIQTTLLVIIVSFLFICNQLIISAIFTLSSFIERKSVKFHTILLFLYLLELIGYSMNMIVYYSFSRSFADKIRTLFFHRRRMQ